MKRDTSELALRAGVALELLSSRVVREERTFRRLFDDFCRAAAGYNALNAATKIELPEIPDHWDWTKVDHARTGILKKKWSESCEDALRDEQARGGGDRDALPLFRIAMRAVRIAKLSPVQFRSRIADNATELEDSLAAIGVAPATSRHLIGKAEALHRKAGRRRVSFEEVADVAEGFLREVVALCDASADEKSGLVPPDVWGGRR